MRKETTVGWFLNGCQTIQNENLSSITILYLIKDLKIGGLVKMQIDVFNIGFYQFIKAEGGCFYFFNLNGDSQKMEILECGIRVQITTSKAEGIDLKFMPLKEPQLGIE